MGAVYLARRKKDGASVALKVMLSKIAVDDHSRTRFMREVETTRALRHNNIVEFLDSGAAGGAFYFILELCAGGSVADLMQRQGGRLKLADAAPIMLDALEGLGFATKTNLSTAISSRRTFCSPAASRAGPRRSRTWVLPRTSPKRF
jgi:serine/threonine protein kinase